MNVTERAISICTQTIGFVYHPPSESRPYNGFPVGQLRKFLCRNKNIPTESLVKHLVENEEHKVFSRLIFIGLKRSEQLKRDIISFSVESGKYSVLLKANRLFIIGRSEIDVVIPKKVFGSLRNVRSFPHEYVSIYLALKSEKLWDSRMPSSPSDVINYVGELKRRWSLLPEETFLRQLNLALHSIIYYDDLDAFKIFYCLIPDNQKINLCYSWECEKLSAERIAEWLFFNRREYIHHPYLFVVKNAEQVVKEKLILELANHPDYYVRTLVRRNDDLIWEKYASTFTSPPSGVADYVNLSHMIVFGAKFPDRHPEVIRLRKLLE